ncbi:MAG: hypothetical protein E7Z90_01125 [Cyanobacteria bacterium SIG29]|nr:hypothetical protein [Cyanobacteria bacterium SIG29]
MASIINAIRNISSDKWWALKLPILAAPIFMVLDNNIIDQLDSSSNVLMLVLLSLVYFGCAGFLMHQNINNKSPFLPSLFHLPSFFKYSIVTSLISLPLIMIYLYIMNYIIENVILEPFIMWVIYICVTLFLSPFVFIPAVLYSARGKFSDIFKFNIIIEAGGNFSVQFLSFILQYFFTLFLLTVLFYYLFINMLENDTVLNIVYSLSFVISFLTLYSYCSDMYDEVIPVVVKEDI